MGRMSPKCFWRWGRFFWFLFFGFFFHWLHMTHVFITSFWLLFLSNGFKHKENLKLPLTPNPLLFASSKLNGCHPKICPFANENNWFLFQCIWGHSHIILMFLSFLQDACVRFTFAHKPYFLNIFSCSLLGCTFYLSLPFYKAWWVKSSREHFSSSQRRSRTAVFEPF